MGGACEAQHGCVIYAYVKYVLLNDEGVAVLNGAMMAFLAEMRVGPDCETETCAFLTIIGRNARSRVMNVLLHRHTVPKSTHVFHARGGMFQNETVVNDLVHHRFLRGSGHNGGVIHEWSVHMCVEWLITSFVWTILRIERPRIDGGNQLVKKRRISPMAHHEKKLKSHDQNDGLFAVEPEAPPPP